MTKTARQESYNDGQRCVVGSQTAQMLKLAHPWVLQDSYTRKWPAGRSGELVVLVDEDGRELGYALRDDDRIVARVVAARAVNIDRQWFVQRLQQAVALRRHCISLEETDALRLVNGEGDGLPGVTVDRYGDYLLVQFYCQGWQRFQAPLVAALRNVYAPVGIYLKRRPQDTRQAEKMADKAASRLVWGERAPLPLTVRENGLDFLVNLERGLNTGLFMDQRAHRVDLMARVAGKRVLNLFAYTGAFSVAAAAAGASRVTSVDVSANYLALARENFAINRLNPKRHRFIVADCFAALAEMAAAGECFDVVIMDPPSFSTTGKSRFTTSAGTARLVELALAVLSPGGLLVTSSNHQKVDVADYLKELRRGALNAAAQLRVIKLSSQGEDFPYPVTFPQGRYLKYVLAVKC